MMYCPQCDKLISYLWIEAHMLVAHNIKAIKGIEVPDWAVKQ